MDLHHWKLYETMDELKYNHDGFIPSFNTIFVLFYLLHRPKRKMRQSLIFLWNSLRQKEFLGRFVSQISFWSV